MDAHAYLLAVLRMLVCTFDVTYGVTYESIQIDILQKCFVHLYTIRLQFKVHGIKLSWHKTSWHCGNNRNIVRRLRIHHLSCLGVYHDSKQNGQNITVHTNINLFDKYTSYIWFAKVTKLNVCQSHVYPLLRVMAQNEQARDNNKN